MKSKTETIIAALRQLAEDIQTDDGVLLEAADRLSELDERVNRMETELIRIGKDIGSGMLIIAKGRKP